MAARVELDESGVAHGVIYDDEAGGSKRLQRARTVAVAGYSTET